MSENKKAKQIDLFNIRLIDTKNGQKASVQFSKDVVITFRGEEVDMGQYGSFFLRPKAEMVKDLDFKLDKGWLSEESYNQQLEILENKKVTSSCKVPLKGNSEA